MKNNLFAAIIILISCGCSGAPAKEQDRTASSPTGAQPAIVVSPQQSANTLQVAPEMRKKIAVLISRLGAEEPVARDGAERELIAIGEPAKEQLLLAIENDRNPESVARAKFILSAIKPVKTSLALVQVWKEINGLSGVGLNAPESEWEVKINDAVAKARQENPDITKKSSEMFSHVCKARINYIFFTWGWSVKRGHSFMWYARDPDTLPEPQKARNRICHEMEKNIMAIRDFAAGTNEDPDVYEKSRKNLAGNIKELFGLDNVDGIGAVSDADAIEMMRMIDEITKQP